MRVETRTVSPPSVPSDFLGKGCRRHQRSVLGKPRRSLRVSIVRHECRAIGVAASRIHRGSYPREGRVARHAPSVRVQRTVRCHFHSLFAECWIDASSFVGTRVKPCERRE